ncbi:MAG: D-alanine--D-alanine ligase family protein [Candidatus Nanopelagicales bacterium]
MAPTLARRATDSVAAVAIDRRRVLVVFGGRSSEHAISCLSAAGILRALDPQRYDVSAVGIRPDGRWVQASVDPRSLEATGGQLPAVAEGESVALLAEPVGADVSIPGVLRGIDVVFPVLHGPWGEDGTVQGLLEMAGIPYVGSGVFASAAAMDKGHMKAMLAHGGLPVGSYVVITDQEWEREPAACRERIAALGFPVFIKPARAGSSVGISKVADAAGLDAAIAEARRSDRRIIAEAAVADAREIECGVLVDASGAPQASRCAEIRITGGHEFYDFEAKYLDDAAELIVPAELDPAVEDEVRRLAIRAFGALGCEGLARVDFFVRDDGILVNEVNTMPGFTPISMFPRMWGATGIDYAALVDRLVDDAVRKGTGLR